MAMITAAKLKTYNLILYESFVKRLSLSKAWLYMQRANALPLEVVFGRCLNAIFATLNKFRTMILQKRYSYLSRVEPRSLKTLDLKQTVNVRVICDMSQV